MICGTVRQTAVCRLRHHHDLPGQLRQSEPALRKATGRDVRPVRWLLLDRGGADGRALRLRPNGPGEDLERRQPASETAISMQDMIGDITNSF